MLQSGDPAHRRRLPRRHADRRHPLLRPQPARPTRRPPNERPGQPARRPRPTLGDREPGDRRRRTATTRGSPRRERLALLGAPSRSSPGAIIVGFWVLCAIFGELLVPQDPLASDPINDLLAPVGGPLVRHGQARPRRLLARHRRRARHPDRRAARPRILGHGPGHRARARDGLLPRARRRRAEPDHRGVPGAAA